MQKHYTVFLSLGRQSAKQEGLFKNTPEIGKMLENPLVSLKEKEQVIERVFPQEMKSFLKVTCKYQKIDRIGEILEAYDAYSREQKGILKAELLYVTRPAEEQENKMKEFLRSQIFCQRSGTYPYRG